MSDTLPSYAMKGRLVLSSSGWFLLEVPNAIGNGCFQALHEPGIEQPISSATGKYNAHISVIRPEEVEQLGGPDKVKDRGKMFGFTVGGLREIPSPGGWAEVSKVWALEAKSPELMQLRRSLGLGDPKYPFHITVAIRKKNSLRKSASLIHFTAGESGHATNDSQTLRQQSLVSRTVLQELQR